MENWLPVVGHEGRYEVSDCGRVRALFSHGPWKAPRFLRLIPANRCKRYRMVNLYANQKGRLWMVHRLVMAAFVRTPEPGEQVNHINGNPTDNSLANLEYCTGKENIAHAWRMGLLTHPPKHPPGEGHPSATITEETAIEIIRRGAAGERTCKIAKAVGASYQTVGMIKRGQTWRHLPRPAVPA